MSKVFVALVWWAGQAVPQEPPRSPWSHDVKGAREAALKAGKPCAILFAADRGVL